jgi:hAT family C-terminal dimerisation region
MCTDTINGSTQTGFTTPAVKMAASAMLEKLLKYYDNAKSQLNRVALFLDPRSSNSTPDAQLLKEIVRLKLATEYRYNCGDPGIDQEDNVVPTHVFDLFAANSETEPVIDEVEDFFALTSRPDKSCKDPIFWWKMQSIRFPSLSNLARDTLMIMGSSVPAESAFSDSDDFVRGDRSSLSDTNIEEMMKLRSWNRLFNKFG